MSPPADASSTPLRVLLDQPPITLNPRQAIDATGQRIGALIFRALSRNNTELVPQPDLAESWQVSKDGQSWTFKIRPGLKDHGGEAITAELITSCLEQYREGKPTSALRSAMPGWKSTRVQGDRVVVELTQPDPYLASNLTLLRYFRWKGAPGPCVEPPQGTDVITSGPLKTARWESAPEQEITLEPFAPLLSGEMPRALRIRFVKDEGTRTLTLLRGGADAAQNTISLTKTRWLAKNGDFEVLEREGVNVSYLAFNAKDPLLGRLEIRRAISLAIDREGFVRNKMMGFGTLAGSFLSPLLAENLQSEFPYDPARAEKILDEAGFPRGENGIRLKLTFRTTPVREGIETVLVFQDMLKKIGVDLRLEVVEPGVFLQSIRRGKTQLFLGRWIGVSDASILYRTLLTGQSRNRVGYSDPGMDSLLKRISSEADLSRRVPIAREAQAKMAADLPYLPLWFWKNALILRKGSYDPSVPLPKLSLSGSLEPLTRIR